MTPRVQARWRTRGFVLLASTLVALLAAEAALRWVVFAESPTVRRLGDALRQPELYAEVGSEDFWRLQLTFLAPEERKPAPVVDPTLGWAGAFDPKSFEHRDEARIGARRPVLLFGDSFAECCTAPGTCFQSLLDESDLGATHCLLNYGCGGYGPDQVMLVVEGASRRFAGRDPIVVVSFLVDDDPGRAPLAVRGWPKPRFRLRDGTLVVDGPVETDPDRFLEVHPPQVASYLLALVARGLRDPAQDPEVWSEEETRELNAAIVDRIEAGLVEHGIEHSYLLFCGEATLAKERGTWGERMLVDLCRARSLPAISTRPHLEHAARGDPRGVAALFGSGGRVRAHYNEAGNRVAFVALRQAILRNFDTVDTEAIDLLRTSGALARGSSPVRTLELFGRVCILRTPDDTPSLRVEWEEGASTRVRRLLLRGAHPSPVELEIRFERPQRRFRARVLLADPASSVPLRVEVRAGERVLVSERLGAGAVEIDVESGDAASVSCVVVCESESPAGEWAAFEDIRFE